MYICKLIKRKVDDEPVEVWYLFRPTVINKTGDLSTEIAKFLFFRRRSKDLSLISLPINLENMGKIIALANQKGGVGKTTTTINLDAILDTEIDSLKVISSHINLVGAEIEMLNLPNREKILKEVLTPLKKEYDYILIDCSPSLGLITINALTAADSVIIPVQAEYFALEGISKLLNTIKIIKSKLNPALEIEGFLLTMYDSRLRQANQIYDEVKRHFQELVFNTVIQRNVKLSEAPSYGVPTILYDADSTGAKNHLALAKEIINRNK